MVDIWTLKKLRPSRSRQKLLKCRNQSNHNAHCMVLLHVQEKQQTKKWQADVLAQFKVHQNISRLHGGAHLCQPTSSPAAGIQATLMQKKDVSL